MCQRATDRITAFNLKTERSGCIINISRNYSASVSEAILPVYIILSRCEHLVHVSCINHFDMVYEISIH